MKKLIEYIDRLMSQSFEGWTDDEINAYKTALISISEFIKKDEKTDQVPTI